MGRWVNTGLWIAVLSLIALSLAACRPAPAGQAAQPASVSVQEAAARRNAGAFVLDVRPPAEYQEFRIPGSTLIPFEELTARLAEIPRDREIVVVCAFGGRSMNARDTLLKAGFARVVSMEGGMTAWRSAGQPVE